jgi:diguanylate cyclase (GGDEF)-like protein/PAS domain S-box-containing protein
MFSSEPSIVEAVGRANALVVLDVEGRVQRWSEGAARLWGWSEQEVRGRHWVELDTITDSVRAARAAALVVAVLGGASHDFEWTSRRAGGGAVRLHTSLCPLRDAVGAVVGIVCLSFDTSEREAFEQALVRAALHDQLTGLPGRSLFVHEVGLALSDRRGPHGVAVLFIDLDRFKRVNDEHGHATGDVVLVAIADRLRAAVRDGDLVARMGGDEFAVLVRGGAAPVAADVADRISRMLAEPMNVNGPSLEVGASLGVAIAGPDDDAEDVLARADAAMYRAKRADPTELQRSAVSASGRA